MKKSYKRKAKLDKIECKIERRKITKSIRWKWDVNTICVDYMSVYYSGASLIKITNTTTTTTDNRIFSILF